MALSSGTRGVLSEGLSWAAAGAMLVAGVVYFDEIRTFSKETLGLPSAAEVVNMARGGAKPAKEPVRKVSGEVALSAARDGHYYSAAEINGRSIDVMVDTGASLVALTYEDAERAGIYVKDSDFTMRISTANGVGRAAPVRLNKISIGDITVRDVPAAVSESGRLFKTLLGMSFLSRLSRAELRGGTLTLAE
jgi:aspartyl protease family protein